MKMVKLSSLIFVLSSGLTQLAQAVEDTTVVDTMTSANAGTGLTQVEGNIDKGTGTIKEGVKDQVFDQARKNGGAEEAQLYLQQLEGRFAGAKSVAELMNLVNSLEEGNSKCVSYAEEGVNCCENPKSCGGSGESITGQADAAANQTAQSAQAAAGGQGGAALQCLSALPGLMAMVGKSKGAGEACGLIRRGSGEKKGCTDICSGFEQLAKRAESKAMAFMNDPQQAPMVPMVVDKARSIGKEANTSAKTCSAKTKAGESAASAQAGTGSQAIMGLMGCLQALMSGDETKAEGEDELLDQEVEPLVAVNCSNISERSANPDQCIGYTGGDGFGDDFLSKTSGSDLAIESGDAASGLTDLPNGEEGSVDGTPAGATGEGSPGMKTTNPAMATLSGGAGAGGANEKTGGRRRGGKEKDLIAGYKSVKSGGGSGFGRSPASKGFKPFSFEKKKKKDKDKKALAAMSKLMKAGISPDQTGSIFVRASKRFATSSTKEKLFDARRNRSLWMEKRK